MTKTAKDCQWFLTCTRPAVVMVPHPILKVVPCCAKCAAFAKKIGAA